MSEQNVQRTCLIRLSGTTRTKFVNAGNLQITPGDWVAIDIGSGVEPAQVVVAPDQWIEPPKTDALPDLLRKLDETGIASVAENIERGRAMIQQAAEVVREHSPQCRLTGLRFTLASDTAIAVYYGNEPADLDLLATKLSETLNLAVHPEQDHPGDLDQALLGGATLNPDRSRTQSLRQLLEDRLDALREPESFAPHGMPRLNSTVQTPHGQGRLVAVDIRHWKATVQLADGEESTCGIDDLIEP